MQTGSKLSITDILILLFMCLIILHQKETGSVLKRHSSSLKLKLKDQSRSIETGTVPFRLNFGRSDGRPDLQEALQADNFQEVTHQSDKTKFELVKSINVKLPNLNQSLC